MNKICCSYKQKILTNWAKVFKTNDKKTILKIYHKVKRKWNYVKNMC